MWQGVLHQFWIKAFKAAGTPEEAVGSIWRAYELAQCPCKPLGCDCSSPFALGVSRRGPLRCACRRWWLLCLPPRCAPIPMQAHRAAPGALVPVPTRVYRTYVSICPLLSPSRRRRWARSQRSVSPQDQLARDNVRDQRDRLSLISLTSVPTVRQAATWIIEDIHMQICVMITPSNTLCRAPESWAEPRGQLF